MRVDDVERKRVGGQDRREHQDEVDESLGDPERHVNVDSHTGKSSNQEGEFEPTEKDAPGGKVSGEGHVDERKGEEQNGEKDDQSFHDIVPHSKVTSSAEDDLQNFARSHDGHANQCEQVKAPEGHQRVLVFTIFDDGGEVSHVI